MSPSRPIAPAAPRSGLRKASAHWAALCALAALAGSCTDDKVAGTSSGVDNPALTVSFAAASGGAERITGDLDVYGADQNPALDPEPLATIRIKNSTSTRITGADFQRAREASAKRAATKRAATGAERTEFNLLLTTHERKGAFVLSLAYDSAAGAFIRSDTSIKAMTLKPLPLVRYAARVAKDTVHGVDCRVFVPGSPFLATLVDSQFVMGALPPGLLPLRLIGTDGRVYPVPDSLNTADTGKVYRPATTPLGSIDTLEPPDTIPAFDVVAPTPHETFLGMPEFLEAAMVGVSASDPRLSILWKWLPDSAWLPDSQAVNGGMPPPPPPVEILSPTTLRTELYFRREGVYAFQVSATVGSRVRTDTTLVYIKRLPPPGPAVLHPVPAESVSLSKPYTIEWQMIGKGPYTVQLSVDNGAYWFPLVVHYYPPYGWKRLNWVWPTDAPPADRCLIRVNDESDTTLRAVMTAPFSLVH